MADRKKILSHRRLCMILDVMMLLALGAWLVNVVISDPQGHYDPDRSQFPVKGIDVSAHNGDIDFERVSADTVTFVIIKATEGTDFCDSRFRLNLARASEAGLKVGAYHFFRFDSPGSAQAQHFLNTIDGATLHLPLVIDVEKWGNPADFDVDQVKAQLRVMVESLRAAGHPVMIYTNKQGYNSIIYGAFSDVPLWLCSLSGMPLIDWQLWQHSHEGVVEGIDGHVDINTYHGAAATFDEWTAAYTVGTPAAPEPEPSMADDGQ